MAGGEIWVHLSGPSSATDDIRYRQMLQVYGEFQSARNYSSTRDNLSSRGHIDTAVVTPQTSNIAQAATETPVRTEIVEQAKEQCIIPRSALAEINQKTCSSSSDQSVVYVGETPAALATLESQLLTSSLLAESPAVSPLQSRVAKSRCILNSTAAESEASEELPAISPGVVQVANQGDQSQTNNTNNASSPLLSQARKAGVSYSKNQEKLTYPHLSIKLNEFPYEIQAPPPAVALLPAPATLITPKLQQLAEMLDLPSRFRPTRKSRDLSLFERGYWRIDTASWPAPLKTEFWVYLQEFVGAGAAGWGVSCYAEPLYKENRVETHAVEDMHNELGDTSQCEAFHRLFRLVRIYCWGEIVGHVYLLAFVASRSKVKHVGAAWVDAGGEQVVQMA